MLAEAALMVFVGIAISLRILSCAQGKDRARSPEQRRCCAIGQCCGQRLSERTIKNIRDTLRAALSNAVAEELVTRNVASVVRLPVPRKHKNAWWSVDKASAFLESARTGNDPLYAAYVLVLVLGLRRGRSAGPHVGRHQPRRT